MVKNAYRNISNFNPPSGTFLMQAFTTFVRSPTQCSRVHLISRTFEPAASRAASSSAALCRDTPKASCHNVQPLRSTPSRPLSSVTDRAPAPLPSRNPPAIPPQQTSAPPRPGSSNSGPKRRAVSIEPGWENTLEDFDQAVAQNALGKISTARLAKLVHMFAGCAETQAYPPSPTTPPTLPQQFGRRMEQALDELETRESTDTGFPPSFRTRAWRIEAAANLGHLDSISTLPTLSPAPTKALQPFIAKQHQEAYVALRTFRRILLIHHLQGVLPKVSFSILRDHWHFLEPLLFCRPGTYVYKVEREVESLRPLALRLAGEFTGFHEHIPMPDRDVLALVLSAQCNSHHGVLALRTYRLMQRRKLALPEVLVIQLLRTLVSEDLLEDAGALISQYSQVFALETSWPEAHDAALGFFSKRGRVEEAEARFKRLGELYTGAYKDRHYTWMMQAAAMAGQPESVIRLFHRFFGAKKGKGSLNREPTLHHYAIVVQAYANAGDADGVETWMQKVVQAGYSPDVAIFNIVLKFFADRDDLESVQSTLNKVDKAAIKWTLATYTILVKMFAARKDPGAAEMIVRRAMDDGIQPDVRMIYAMLDAHVQAGSWEGVIQIFNYLESRHLSPIRYSTPCFNHVLKAFVTMGAPFNTVLHAFNRMKVYGLRPSQQTYNHVIRSASETGRMEEATRLLKELDHLSTDPTSGLEVNASILTVVMAGYLRLPAKNKAREVFEEILSRGLKPDASCFAVIIKAYANERTQESLTLAEEFLKEVLESHSGGGSIYNKNALNTLLMPLMIAHAAQGTTEQVEEYLQSLLSLGGKATVPALTVMMDGYRRSGDVESVKRLWQQIFDSAMTEPNEDLVNNPAKLSPTCQPQRRRNSLIVPLSIFIDALSTAGLFNDIAIVWKSVQESGFAFDAGNWNHLALASIRAGQPERAFQIIENVIIPYQHQHRESLHRPNRHSNSPFLSTQNRQPHDRADPPLNTAARRSAAARSATYSQRQDDYRDVWRFADPSLPLRLIRQTSPSMNFWRVEAATLNALHNVLLRLGEGYVIAPTSTAHQHPPREYNPVEASQILHRIENGYPLTIRMMSRTKSRYHKTRTRVRRKDPHGWLIGVSFGPQPQWGRARELQRMSMKRRVWFRRRRRLRSQHRSGARRGYGFPQTKND